MCEYCSGNPRRSARTLNNAFKVSIRSKIDGTKFKTPRLCIGKWNGYTRKHQYDGSFPIKYCFNCGEKLVKNEEE